MTYEFEKATIKKRLGDVYNLLKETKCILAGGALTSLFSGKEINDWDIYCTSKESISEVFTSAWGVSESYYLGQFDLVVKFATERSLLCVGKNGGEKIQFIHYKTFKDAQDIFNSFDFEHCMAAYDFATEEFVFHPHFFKSLAQRKIVFNSETDFPVVSLLRVDKYKQKGYEISKAQMLRIAFTIASKKYSSWEDVKSECSGMYGVAPDKLFDETKPFSLEEVVNQLSTISLDSINNIVGSPSFEECCKLIKGSACEKWVGWYDFILQELSMAENCWYKKSLYDIANQDKFNSEE